MPGWIVLAVVVAILLVLLAVFYNRFVALRQQVRAAYSDIDVQLKRRHDLIANLVETVKGYASHERGVFDEVARARADAIAAGAEPPAERATAENTLSGA
ncbi:MAG: LemA family protein, partial [Chloroflexi bacterium]